MFITRRIPSFLLAPDETTATEPSAAEGTPGTPSEPSPAAPTVDWEKRYTDLHPEYTRATQEASELRQRDELYRTFLTTDDPDARREAAEALGFDYEDPEPELGADPNEDLRRRVEAQEARWEQMTQAQQEQATFDRDVAHVGEGMRALAKQLGRDLTPKEVKRLGDAAWQDRDEQGLPNIADVCADHVEWLTAHTQTPRPRAPHVPGSGQAATHVPELETRAQIADYIAAEVAALDED